MTARDVDARTHTRTTATTTTTPTLTRPVANQSRTSPASSVVAQCGLQRRVRVCYHSVALVVIVVVASTRRSRERCAKREKTRPPLRSGARFPDGENPTFRVGDIIAVVRSAGYSLDRPSVRPSARSSTGLVCQSHAE